MRSRTTLCAARRVVATARPVLLAALAASLAVVGPATGAGAAGAPRTRASLDLDDQTEWVVAPAGASAASFDLGLSARHAPAGATVEAVLYPRLLTRDDFEDDVHSGPHGYPLASSAPLALASLPPDPRAAGGAALDLSVVQTASSGQGSRLGLDCAPPTGSGTCTGVYPVVVELQRAGGQVLRRFTTFLTYVAGASAHPLDVAWVVPVSAPVSLSTDPSRPTRAIRPLVRGESSALQTLIAQLHSSPQVPVTVDASPQTLQALAKAGARGRAADASLAAMSGDPSTDEVQARPYVPVDLGALAGAGEPTEIKAQMAAGSTVLHGLHVDAGSPSPWVQSGPVGNDIAGGLAQAGASQLVVPKVDLASTSSATSSGTWTSTFTLALSRGGTTTSVRAAESDTWLDGQFTSDRGDPVLAATQVLADLAMVHFERPNTTAVRGMVAVPPATWSPDARFDRTLLAGLSKNPVVRPVTLSELFASVTSDGTRQLEPGAGPVLGRSLASAISRARVNLSDFDDAVAGHPPIEGQLDDLLLAAEADTLETSQKAGVSTFDKVLTGQLQLVQFATEKTVTLTSRTGLIPITVESRAPYTVVGRLSLSGNKFTFPRSGARGIMRLDHATNATRVDVTARSPGDMTLHVAFESPNGRLVIARDLLTVRSTATSVVGIVLSALALAVLLAWWARTWWSGRRRRRTGRTRRIGSGSPAGSGATAP